MNFMCSALTNTDESCSSIPYGSKNCGLNSVFLETLKKEKFLLGRGVRNVVDR